MINARKIVGLGIPTEEGRKLARHLLQKVNLDWNDVENDLRECRAGLLISAFFNGFLQQVLEDKPEILDVARTVRWELKHEFQRENVARWMQGFQPADELHPAGA